MATYRAPKVILPIFNPLVYPVEEAPGEILPEPILVGYTFTALYEYAQPNPNTDLITGKWENIACSDNCNVLYLPEGNLNDIDEGYIYVTDSGSPPNDGSAFVTRGAFNNYIGIACSADGTRAVTSGFDTRRIYWTSNSGVTWNTYTGFLRRFTNFACSSSGLIMYGAGQTSYLHKSTDGGNSWAQLNSAGNRNWSGVACVPDGSIVYGCVGSSFDPKTGRIYKSTDSGSNWTQLSAPLTIYASISCDSTGQIVIASALSGVSSEKVFVSTNGGSSWTTTSLTGGDFLAVKCSPDGTKLFACSAGALFYSLDLGVNWTNAGISKTFTGVTCNTDGTIVYAVDNTDASTGGNVWRGFPEYITS